MVAGLLAIFIGGSGVHRFYLGYIWIGVAQLVLGILGSFYNPLIWINGIWVVTEGALILTRNIIRTDGHGNLIVD